MAYNDPVLQRSMFQKQGQSVTPAVGLGGGLGSMTSPDENAKALRSMFAPTVDLNMPSQMLGQPQQPVQSFQEGGPAVRIPGMSDEADVFDYLVKKGVPEERARAEASRIARSSTREGIGTIAGSAVVAPAATMARNLPAYLMSSQMGYTPLIPMAGRVMASGAGTGASLGTLGAAAEAGRERAANPPVREPVDINALEPLGSPGEMAGAGAEYPGQRSTGAGAGIPSVDITRPIRAMTGSPADTTVTKPTPRPTIDEVESQYVKQQAGKKEEPSISTKLDDIRQERLTKEQERSAAERRENMLLALMQAGFAMAAGRSPNAISNIGAGGQAGIGAFATMERARREDEAMRRREALQLDIAKMQLEKDPEAVRTYAILGGWTPQMGREGYQAAVQKGFQFMQTKEAPARAEALLKLSATDPMLLSEEQKKQLTRIAYGSVTSALTGEGKPPAGTVIPWSQLSPK